jgi:hypothetical protein
LLLMLFWLKRIDDGLTVPLPAKTLLALFAATDKGNKTGKGPVDVDAAPWPTSAANSDATSTTSLV